MAGSARIAGLFALGALLAAAGARPASAETCGEAISAVCIDRFGAGALAAEPAEAEPVDADSAAAARCREEAAAYRRCLAEIVEGQAADPQAADPQATGPRAAGAGRCDGETARLLWSEVSDDDNCLGYQAFLEACPASPFSRLAAARSDGLACDAPAAATAPGNPSAPAPAPREPRAAEPAPAASAQSGAPGRDGCIILPEPFETPLQVRKGDRVCAPRSSEEITVLSVQRRSLSYRNGPRGLVSCRPDEVCGVYWSGSVFFRVVLEPGSGGAEATAMLIPTRP